MPILVANWNVGSYARPWRDRSCRNGSSVQLLTTAPPRWRATLYAWRSYGFVNQVGAPERLRWHGRNCLGPAESGVHPHGHGAYERQKDAERFAAVACAALIVRCQHASLFLPHLAEHVTVR